MTNLPHAKSPGEKGKWWWFKDQTVVSCPTCENSDARDHDISPDGTVTPSVACHLPSRNFHVHVKLVEFF